MESNDLIESFDLKFNKDFSLNDDDVDNDDFLIMNTKLEHDIIDDVDDEEEVNDDYDDEDENNMLSFDLNEDLKDLVINNDTLIEHQESAGSEEAGLVNNFQEENNDHLPRVQVELDKLNYTNESINNLELELEESQKEYLELSKESEERLNKLEKTLGSCVQKAKVYYDALIQLNESKEKYLKAKNSFERAQALYVAAKEMQIYAEDSLEFHAKSPVKGSEDASIETTESFLELLDNSKKKVQETGQSKQKFDIEQIEAQKIYQDSYLNVQKLEKNLKKTILKSKPYYELKASINKELKFQLCKVEGLKSCLKEAKSLYQQSLNNLESISSEIHTQRQQNSLLSANSQANTQSITPSTSSSSTSYNRNDTTSSANDDENVYNSNKKKINKRSTSSSNNSITDISIDSNNANSCISDEQILNLGLDNKLYKYKQQIKLRPQFRASVVMKTNI